MISDIGLVALISKYQKYPDFCKYSQLSEAERYDFVRDYLSYTSRANAGELITDALNDNRHFFTCFFQAVCDKQKKPDELLTIILSCVDQYMRDTFALWFECVEEHLQREMTEDIRDLKGTLSLVRCA
jgi:hypothetical protein